VCCAALNARQKTIALHGRRVDSYLRDFKATDIILEERGEQLKNISGGRTGYIVKDYKGKNADVPVYAFDGALFRERRAIREQLAKELGQWTERTKVDATVAAVDITRDALRKLSPEPSENDCRSGRDNGTLSALVTLRSSPTASPTAAVSHRL
jgi:hypothetical protein